VYRPRKCFRDQSSWSGMYLRDFWEWEPLFAGPDRRHIPNSHVSNKITVTRRHRDKDLSFGNEYAYNGACWDKDDPQWSRQQDSSLAYRPHPIVHPGVSDL